MNIKRMAKRTVIGLLILILVIILGLQMGVTLKYWDFFRNSDRLYMIPGLNDNYVPQGYDYLEDHGLYLMCGYMSDDTPSRVYIQDEKGNHYFTSLYYEDGTPYLKHAGGITGNGDYVYIAGDTGIDVFLLVDILSGSTAKLQGVIEMGHDTAYCSAYNGYLLIGNFYYGGHYETPASHRITTPAGDKNTALMTIYRCDSSFAFGIDSTPVAAISTGDKVQGMCFKEDGKVVLSTSWSTGNSHLLYYTLDTQRVDSITIGEVEVPLIYLDSANLVHDAVLPPMSEELVCRNGRIEVMVESACNKYLYGKFIRGWSVRAYMEP